MAKVIRIIRNNAETVRSDAMRKGVLDPTFRITADGNDVLIPVTDDIEGYVSENAELEPLEHKETDYRRLVDIGEDLKEQLPSSLDIIGDIAIIKIPDMLRPFRREIGEAIMSVQRHRMVMMDSGVKGGLRIRELETIAGSGSPETVHREFGVRMAIDPSKVYFNPRLAAERMRIASLVMPGETVIDMFAGAAPFPLVISKHSDAGRIYAIDLNNDALAYMERSIGMNKTDNVIAICGDSRKIIKELPRADRIIMNLPQSAMDFLNDALASLKIGGVVHLYRIMERDAGYGDMIETARSSGYDVCIKERIELKTYSPSMSVFAFDIVRLS